MKGRLAKLEEEALSQISSVKDVQHLSELKIKYLGRKGVISSLVKDLPSLPLDDRRRFGRLINKIKCRIEGRIDALAAQFSEREKTERLKGERVDVTLPGRRVPPGRRHPVTQVLDEVEDIFVGFGFEIAEGPDIESDYYNFEALNIPKDHPARDMQDTFYISENLLLRTHTSPVQIRVMERKRPPVRIIAPGAVYRRDSDLSHTPMFRQVEGFMVDEGITFGDLKGVLITFLHTIFDEELAIRFRPSFFPFTEPSAEVDIQCVICGGSGNQCGVCKGSGWIEVLGSGMIHPNVFSNVGYDPEKVTGFAFGLGIERITMLKFGIDNIRYFFDNDVRFLRQF